LLEPSAKTWALRLADFWNENAERWLFVEDTALARRLKISGYYVRVAPERILQDRRALQDYVLVKNHVDGEQILAAEQIGTEFLQLVRLGLRDPKDPLIKNSTKVVDAILKTETPTGPVWHRYNRDGYGEHEDGRPYDGAGRGRGWPLLTGEGGHYELALGADPMPYLQAMTATTSPCGMMPEQVWDEAPIEWRRLLPGRPTGAAMPLVWAHAEFIKLLASRHLGRPFDRPRAVWQRYQGKRTTCTHACWWPHAQICDVRVGSRLVIALPEPAMIHWGRNGWKEIVDMETIDTGIAFHAVCLDVDRLAAGERVEFTWKWRESGDWHGRDYAVTVTPSRISRAEKACA